MSEAEIQADFPGTPVGPKVALVVLNTIDNLIALQLIGTGIIITVY